MMFFIFDDLLVAVVFLYDVVVVWSLISKYTYVFGRVNDASLFDFALMYAFFDDDSSSKSFNGVRVDFFLMSFWLLLVVKTF